MNKKEILKKVGGILTELNEQFEYLSQSPDNLNELELELFSANANFLSDHLSILVKLNETKAKVETIDDRDSPEVHYQPEPEKVEDVPGEAEEDIITEEESRVINEGTQLKTGTGAEDEDYRKEESSVRDDQEQPVNETSEEINSDIYVKEVVISERTIAIPTEPKAEDNPAQTLNDLLSRSISNQTVGSQLTSQQPKDLKGMISLNDKLVFVRDLFNGYSLAYSEALELLNRFDSFESAENFLKQNYAAKNNWADKQDVADKFYETLNRRFAK